VVLLRRLLSPTPSLFPPTDTTKERLEFFLFPPPFFFSARNVFPPWRNLKEGPSPRNEKVFSFSSPSSSPRRKSIPLGQRWTGIPLPLTLGGIHFGRTGEWWGFFSFRKKPSFPPKTGVQRSLLLPPPSSALERFLFPRRGGK